MGFAVRRLLYGLFVEAVVITIAFFLIRLTGDPAALIAGSEATPEQIAQIRQALHLDQPLWAQYEMYMGNVVNGDFGRSFFTPDSAMHMVWQTVPNSFVLAGVAIGLAVIIGLPIGAAAGVRQNSPADWAARVLSVLGQSTPAFWLGILLILLFSVHLRWLPYGGAGGWRHLVLPALTLAAITIPIVVQVARSALMDTLRQDYIRTARSKGLSNGRVLLKHALANASLPIVTVIGLRLGAIIGGAVVTETVFSYPGLGRLTVQAAVNRDFTVVQALLVVVSSTVVVLNLATDWLYALLDPRIRY